MVPGKVAKQERETEMKKMIWNIMSILVITLYIQGCSFDQVKNDAHYNKFTKEEIASFPYKINEEQFLVYDPLTCESDAIIVRENHFIGNTLPNRTCEQTIKRLSISTGKLEAVDYQGTLDQEAWIWYAKGNQRTAIYDENKEELSLFDGNNNLVMKKSLAYIDGIKDITNNTDYSSLLNISCDDDYVYIIANNNVMYNEDGSTLFILDQKLQLVYTDKTNTQMWRSFQNKYKGCVLSYNNKNFYRYHEETKSLKEDTTMCMHNTPSELTNIISGDMYYDFYYTDLTHADANGKSQTDLWGVKEGKSYRILNIDELGLTHNVQLLPDYEGGFIACDWNGENTKEIFSHIKRGKEGYSIKDDKTVLTIAGLYCMDEVKRAVTNYNLSSDKYYIELIEYSEKYDNANDAHKAFNLDILDGDKIDGILLYGITKRDFMEKTVLEDLNAYFAKSSIVSKDDFLDCVASSWMDQNGKIYSIYTGFELSGIFCDKNFDMNAFTEYLNVENPKRLLFAEKDAGIVVRQLLKYSGNQYVDQDKKTTHFDKKFKNLIKIVKKQNDCKYVTQNDYPEILLVENRADIMLDNITFPYSYFFYEYLLGENFKNIGNNGKAIIVPNAFELGICEKSKNKEGMYDFLDYIFSDDYYYGNQMGKWEFPVLKSFMNDWKLKLTAKEDYTDRFGDLITVHDFDYAVGDVNTSIKRVSDNKYESMNKMVEEAIYIEPLPDKYLNIIEEETQYYFTNQRTLEETVNNIENRVKNALRE